MGCKVRLVHEPDMDSSDKLTRFFSSGNGKFSYVTGMVDLQNLDALELTSGGRKVVRIIYGACPPGTQVWADGRDLLKVTVPFIKGWVVLDKALSGRSRGGLPPKWGERDKI